MDKSIWILFVLATAVSCWSRPRSIRCSEYCDIDPNDRDLCPATPENTPPNRVNTTDRLLELRNVMRNTSLTGGHRLDAYLVYEGSYYGGGVTDHDRRMLWISGFSGSSGHVVVTASYEENVPNRAALWTDGRYWLQADQEMDCNWILMKEGLTDTPNSVQWLLDILPENAKVGADPNYMDTTTWKEFEGAFASSDKNIQLVEVTPDLFEHIWTVENGRPPIISNPIYVHSIEYAGKSWQDKLNGTRQDLLARADVLIVTLLDDIAWLFNLRGSDRHTSPLFDSVAMVEQDSVRLYIRDPMEKIDDIKDHLNTGSDGSCNGSTGDCVEVRDYNNYMADIEAYNNNSAINRIFINIGVSYAVYKAAGSPNPEKRYEDYSPIQLVKSQKNPTEVARYRDCQIRDSAAVVEFIAFLEKEVQQGAYWTELSASAKLTSIRARDPAFKMISFETISAFGPNGAIIHYSPSNATDLQITTEDMYLLDSGGNYLDGTTDITRTFHFGTPTDKHKEAYTRVLMGVIDLATTVWPMGFKGSDIDARTRTPIWQNGWDYNHGTGHGVGYFLNVHEGPGSISVGYSASVKAFHEHQFYSDGPGRIDMGYNPSHSPLYEHMFFSDEPGIYLDNEFGVRIENIVEIVIANTTNRFNDKDYMTFDTVTFVPLETHLIDYSLLETHHRAWLNDYNRKCNETTGQYLLDHGKLEAYNWLMARTGHIPEQPIWTSSQEFGNINGATVTCLLSNVWISVLVAITLRLI